MSSKPHPVGSADRHVFLCWNGTRRSSGQLFRGHMGCWLRETVRQNPNEHGELNLHMNDFNAADLNNKKGMYRGHESKKMCKHILSWSHYDSPAHTPACRYPHPMPITPSTHTYTKPTCPHIAKGPHTLRFGIDAVGQRSQGFALTPGGFPVLLCSK